MAEFREKRPFSRVTFNAPATLTQGGKRWPSEVLDISLKGALATLPESTELNEQQPVNIEIRISDQVEIDMHCRVAHREAGHIGLSCLSIDLDSIQHLRRLIELNLGDSAAMERELSELVAQRTS